MTIRERLGPRLWWIVGTTYAGAGLSLAGFFLGLALWQQPVLAIVLPGLVVVLVASMAGYYICLWCPRCQANLGPLLMYAALRGLAWRVRPAERSWPSAIASWKPPGKGGSSSAKPAARPSWTANPQSRQRDVRPDLSQKPR
jgi:hypothetical protein